MAQKPPKTSQSLSKGLQKMWPWGSKESRPVSAIASITGPSEVKHNPLPPEMLKIIMNAKEQTNQEAKDQLENVYQWFKSQEDNRNNGDFIQGRLVHSREHSDVEEEGRLYK